MLIGVSLAFLASALVALGLECVKAAAALLLCAILIVRFLV